MTEKAVSKTVGLQVDPFKLDENCTLQVAFCVPAELSNFISPFLREAVQSSSELSLRLFCALDQR